MVQEEGWIRNVKGLNVLSIFVCFLCLLFLFVVNYANIFKLIPIPLFSIIAYSLSYFLEFEENKSFRMTWILALNLIATTIWLAIFFGLSIQILFDGSVVLGQFILAIFIVSYPFIMLYYNFRLFMNEISKPEMYDWVAKTGSPRRGRPDGVAQTGSPRRIKKFVVLKIISDIFFQNKKKHRILFRLFEKPIFYGISFPP